ncbi:uncharacterized protein LOC134763205 [Penaeus indicus]|uniref:uncharacterized protein LOC134763205 n=1 Tax=Penaeus indicus TaxID=29960 RepID=UPI00300CDA9E
MSTFNAKEFCENPTLEQLAESIKKDDWRFIAQYFSVPHSGSATKKVIKELVIENLIQRELLPPEAIDYLNPQDTELLEVRDTSILSEQKEESWSSARLEFEKYALDLKLKVERQKLEERARDREIEIAKLKLEERKLEAKLNGTGDNDSVINESFNLTKNLPLVPSFLENDPDGSFRNFEKTAEHFKWPYTEWTWLLQPKLSGKAAITFSNLDCIDDYESVKRSILDAYAITPDGYRQEFRNLTKSPHSTFAEFFTEKARLFNKWLDSTSTKPFSQLKDLLILEEVKRKLPFDILKHIEERGETDLLKAAQIADSFALLKRSQLGKVDKVRFYVQSSSGENLRTNGGKAGKITPLNFCSYCKRAGHTIDKCKDPKCRKSGINVRPFINPSIQAFDPKPVSSVTNVNSPDPFSDFKYRGTVSLDSMSKSHPILILRDTGAAQSIILRSALPGIETKYTGEKVLVKDLTSKISYKLANIFLSSDFVSGEVKIAVTEKAFPIKGISLILGHDLAGKLVYPTVNVVAKPLPYSPTKELDQKQPHIFPVCAVTRSQKLNKSPVEKQNPVDKLISQEITRIKLIAAQNDDPSLAKCRHVASDSLKDHKVPGFYYHDGLLMRVFRPPELRALDTWSEVHQVVIPLSIWESVMKLAHDGLAGHLGIQKTYKKVLQHFYWPGMKKDITIFIRSCHVCQVGGKPHQIIPKAPLHPIQVVSDPFERIVIDCVGPLPKTKKGNQYLFTIMDTATRYPEVYPLKNISASSIVKCLLHFFTSFGIPKEIQCDKGSNFTSDLFQKVLELLGISQQMSTAYHPQSQGCLERFHQTLKSMLKKYCLETGNSWDENIHFLLFALRECPQESLGYSPFELLYGRQIRGPLKVLKDQWFSDSSTPPNQTVASYIDNLRAKLSEARKLALSNLNNAQIKMKFSHDLKSQIREFSPGDKVLLFLPIPGNPLKSKFTGPYVVSHKVSDYNYVVQTPDRRKDTQLVHINLIKSYIDRQPKEDLAKGKSIACMIPQESSITSMSNEYIEETDNIEIPSPHNPHNSEIIANLHKYLNYLPASKINDVYLILKDFPQVTADNPGFCGHTLHDVVLAPEVRPIRQSSYRLSPEKKAVMKKEVDYLLDHGLAEPSNSPWASPSLLVPKSDGTSRLCTDYRKLNKVTIPDSYPLPLIEELVDSIGQAKFITKIDMQKGYYQIGLTDNAKTISAFITPFGLYNYTVMPFGMCNAPATFQRAINYTIQGLEGVKSYLDDLLVISDSWDVHIRRLHALFSRLDEAGFTINLAKSIFCSATVTYLGHIVGQGRTLPKQANVEAIQAYPTPTTRKSLMRFLGMVGFYRRFCSNFSSIATPLTDMTSSKCAFQWTPECAEAFDKLKLFISSEPVLRTPDYSRPFSLQIDASGHGVGAVLLQEDENTQVMHPVSYFSAKLKKHQMQYSTIEREALSLVLALKKFDCYLHSRQPVVVYTDHNPLVFIHRMQNQNQRILRWSLLLQQYNLVVKHIKGVDNVIADSLSREFPTSEDPADDLLVPLAFPSPGCPAVSPLSSGGLACFLVGFPAGEVLVPLPPAVGVARCCGGSVAAVVAWRRS